MIERPKYDDEPAPPLPQSAEPKPLEEILAGKDGKGATGWELLAAADEMARRLRAVAALHVRAKHTDAEGMTYCDACAEDMPCPTAKALAGERQPERGKGYTEGAFRCKRCWDTGTVWSSVVAERIVCPACAYEPAPAEPESREATVTEADRIAAAACVGDMGTSPFLVGPIIKALAQARRAGFEAGERSMQAKAAAAKCEYCKAGWSHHVTVIGKNHRHNGPKGETVYCDAGAIRALIPAASEEGK